MLNSITKQAGITSGQPVLICHDLSSADKAATEQPANLVSEFGPESQ